MSGGSLLRLYVFAADPINRAKLTDPYPFSAPTDPEQRGLMIRSRQRARGIRESSHIRPAVLLFFTTNGNTGIREPHVSTCRLSDQCAQCHRGGH